MSYADSAYRSKDFARACTRLGLNHRLTRPYTPRTNGKAERFIRTALREWAYARAYIRKASQLPVAAVEIALALPAQLPSAAVEAAFGHQIAAQWRHDPADQRQAAAL